MLFPSLTVQRARFSSHLAQNTRLTDVCHVDEDIVRRVTIQRCLEALLVKMMADEANGATKNEETIEGTNLNGKLLGNIKREQDGVP